MLTALVFTLWPLARARDIRAAELFRDLTAARRAWPRAGYVAATAAVAALLVATATLLSGAPELALGTAAGVIGALVLLLLAARGLRRLARRLGRGRATRGRPALRWALAALGGPSGETASVVLVARPRPERAGRHRPDRLEPAQPDHPRPARPRPGLLLRRHPERPARRLPRPRPRRARRDRGRDRPDAARHHHPHQRPPGARGRRPALGAERRPRRHLRRAPRRRARRSPKAPGGPTTTPARR